MSQGLDSAPLAGHYQFIMIMICLTFSLAPVAVSFYAQRLPRFFQARRNCHPLRCSMQQQLVRDLRRLSPDIHRLVFIRRRIISVIPWHNKHLHILLKTPCHTFRPSLSVCGWYRPCIDDQNENLWLTINPGIKQDVQASPRLDQAAIIRQAAARSLQTRA